MIEMLAHILEIRLWIPISFDVYSLIEPDMELRTPLKGVLNLL